MVNKFKNIMEEDKLKKMAFIFEPMSYLNVCIEACADVFMDAAVANCPELKGKVKHFIGLAKVMDQVSAISSYNDISYYK